MLAPRAQDVIRPLVRAGKRDVRLHLERHNLDFAEDPSNKDAAYLRVRVRHEALPLLEQLSPQIVRHLNALADALNGSELPSINGHERLAGEPDLNRAQLQQVLRASRLGRSIAVRVAGGKDLRIKRPREIKS